MDNLAKRIATEISKSGICVLRDTELMTLWRADDTLDIEEKRIRVKNFAEQHGFIPVMDYGLAYVVFRRA